MEAVLDRLLWHSRAEAYEQQWTYTVYMIFKVKLNKVLHILNSVGVMSLLEK